MALNKTITANGSRNHHRFTLSVNEDSTQGNSSLISFTFILSPIIQGYDWYGWGGSISYSITIGDNTYSGTIPSYDGRSTIVLNSASNIEIPHNADGTKTIAVAFSVSDGAGQSYTCGNASASDTFTLSVLHKAPLITNVALQEMNNQLTALSVANDLIIQYLSVKKFTITATLFDSATLSSCSVYYNNALIGTANSNQVTVDFSNVSELILANNKVGLQIQVVDSKGGISSQNYNYNVIKYTRPTIENTSSTIKRKTGGGTNLTDNKANLNFVGTCYKVNDIIGNANTQQVQYKVWNNTEPSYTNVASTASGNNITVTNYEISNVLYTSTYNYKIKIYDTFGNYAEKSGTIPTGKSIWSEYKDRVNFDRATVKNKDVEIKWQYADDVSSANLYTFNFEFDSLLINVISQHPTLNYYVATTLEIEKRMLTDDYIYFDAGSTTTKFRLGISKTKLSLNTASIDGTSVLANATTKIFYR